MQCVDAETLAAWADGGLPKDEAASVELHLADCDRCTAMLATFVRTAPPAPVQESIWTRWRLRWLVPVATAATAVALWVTMPSERSAPTTTLDSELSLRTQAQAPTTTSPEPEPPVSVIREEPLRLPPPPALQETLGSRADAAPQREEKRESESADQSLGRAQAAAAPPAAPPAGTLERDAKSVVAPETPVRDVQSSSAVRLQPGLQIAQLQVISRDSMTRWRVVGPGQVERTTDGGASWQPATLPEAATLTGGSSPSPFVCWLVGRTGAIYLTTDGLRFIRIPFMDRTDFVSIQAIDDRRATVVTIDGRTFRTDDQGATWVRVAP